MIGPTSLGNQAPTFPTTPVLTDKMRQLKGKVKESRKEKRERKKDNLENKSSLIHVVLPVVGVACAVIIAIVMYGTR